MIAGPMIAWWSTSALACGNELVEARDGAWMALAAAAAAGFVVLGAVGTALATWAVLRARPAAPVP